MKKICPNCDGLGELTNQDEVHLCEYCKGKGFVRKGLTYAEKQMVWWENQHHLMLKTFTIEQYRALPKAIEVLLNRCSERIQNYSSQRR